MDVWSVAASTNGFLQGAVWGFDVYVVGGVGNGCGGNGILLFGSGWKYYL